MRVAVSGAHGTGKTTLVEALGRSLPSYATVEEPYYLLLDEGHAFAAEPGLEDFERQLERSIQALEDADERTIFDRCPADFIAYALTHPDAAAFDVDWWLPRAATAMQSLDLIVYVPIEAGVPFVGDDGEGGEARERMDEALRALLLGELGLGTRVVEVAGRVEARVTQVSAHMGGSDAR